MWILLINTSGSESYISLFQDELLISEERSSVRDQSSFLLPAIDSLLNSSHLTIEKIAFIGICTGPGSFTGTRIGVMTAKTLSYALFIPLISFSSDAPPSLGNLISRFLAKDFADPKALDTTYSCKNNI
jgi:tRNA threonylcarbamoyladenosine biosynthesis protein TsaB